LIEFKYPQGLFPEGIFLYLYIDTKYKNWYSIDIKKLIKKKMPVKPKIYSESQIANLRKSYIDDKMSTTDISEKSQELFGVNVSSAIIYKELIRHNIPVRNKSNSISRAKSTLDPDINHINEGLIEWIDGFLLGDGCINFANNYRNSRFRIGTSSPEWTQYAMSGFLMYQPSNLKKWGKIDEKHPNHLYDIATLTHPDIVHQAERWYSGPNQSKVVPPDVRIAPTSMLLWYLGDGSLTYIKDCNTYVVRFATCAFPVDNLENILMPKLRALGLDCSRDESKNDIRIKAASIGRFFDIIGHKSPISCYDYKFDIPDWLRLIRLSDIVQNDKQRWMAQYYYKSGQLECSKSPGGRMLLFTEDQAKKLKIKLGIA